VVGPYWNKPGVRRAGLFCLCGTVAVLAGIGDFHNPGPARFLEPVLGIALLVWAASDFSFTYRKRHGK
jgi:hypothetical protein